MTFNIDPFDSILRSLKALSDLAKKIKKEEMDRRALCYALLEELKHNQRMCDLVLQYNYPVDKIGEAFSREVFDEVCATGIKLSSFKRNKIYKYKWLENTPLAGWRGKPTAELLVKTYDKVSEFVTFYPHAQSGTFKPEVRLKFIRDRIRILLLTINCEK